MRDFELLGLLYASGSVKLGKGHRIEFQTKREEFSEIVFSRLIEFGKARIKKGKAIEVSLSQKEEVEGLLKKIGLSLPFDKEKLPTEALDTSEKRRAFLRGFFEGKSSVSSQKRLIKVSGGVEQLEGLKKLLALEGVMSGIYSTGKYKSLYIQGKMRCESFMKIGFLSKEKNNMLDETTTFGKWRKF
ncbi:MAG: hypothetical protein JW727_04525 [Candidatus Aenigmarchaeota archaeon]|nr:hypothetical protein [Candidatus Aenigmarchaeota archaeon]